MSPWTAKEVLQKIFTPKQILFLLKALYCNYVIEEGDDLKDPFGHDTSPSTLTMPFLLAAGLDQDDFGDARKERYLKEKLYKEEDRSLFMGAGMYSAHQCARLHARLAWAFSCLSGMQQNGGMGSEFDEQSQKEDEESVKDVCRDILHAFGLKPGDL